MELVVGLVVVLGPLVALMVLLVMATRKLWPRRPPVTWTGGSSGPGGDLSGDREPRRPRAPVGAGSVALPEPHEDQRAS